jgi:hypothetical protein
MGHLIYSRLLFGIDVTIDAPFIGLPAGTTRWTVGTANPWGFSHAYYGAISDNRFILVRWGAASNEGQDPLPARLILAIAKQGVVSQTWLRRFDAGCSGEYTFYAGEPSPTSLSAQFIFE